MSGGSPGLPPMLRGARAAGYGFRARERGWMAPASRPGGLGRREYRRAPGLAGGGVAKLQDWPDQRGLWLKINTSSASLLLTCWSWIILCQWSRPVHYRVFSTIPGFSPQDASSSSPPLPSSSSHAPSSDNQKCLQTLSDNPYSSKISNRA